MDNIKRMNIKEFREKGYLQELNRVFLHPLGLALEVQQDEEGNEFINGVWDYREDEEGIYFDLENSSDERILRFQSKSQFIESELHKRKDKRIELFGTLVEPIPETKGIKKTKNNEKEN